MRTIKKGKEPTSLTKFRSSGTAKLPPRYDDYKHKQDLRESLSAEQGAICCYCMQRIRATEDGMKIEHWECQSKHKKKQLNYNNLLGACLGGEGQRPNDQYCDTKKGKKTLSKNPANPTHRIESTLKYLGDGTIESSDKTLNRQLKDVLNLNIEFLKRNRKSTLDAFLASVGGRKGKFTKTQLKKWIKEWESDDSGKRREYCQVVVYWLYKRLKRM